MIRIPSTNDERVYTFARVSGTNKFIVAVNFDLKPFTGSLSLMPQELAADTAITLTDVFTNKTLPITIPASHLIPIEIPAMGFRVFQVQLSNH